MSDFADSVPACRSIRASTNININLPTHIIPVPKARIFVYLILSPLMSNRTSPTKRPKKLRVKIRPLPSRPLGQGSQSHGSSETSRSFPARYRKPRQFWLWANRPVSAPQTSVPSPRTPPVLRPTLTPSLVPQRVRQFIVRGRGPGTLFVY